MESEQPKAMSKRHIKETLENAFKRAKGIRLTGVSKFNVPQVLDIILEYVQASKEALAIKDISRGVGGHLNITQAY